MGCESEKKKTKNKKESGGALQVAGVEKQARGSSTFGGWRINLPSRGSLVGICIKGCVLILSLASRHLNQLNGKEVLDKCRLGICIYSCMRGAI